MSKVDTILRGMPYLLERNNFPSMERFVGHCLPIYSITKIHIPCN